MNRLAMFGCLLALSGCASGPEYWVLEHPPMPREQVIFADSIGYGPYVEGYVKRLPEKDLCLIFVSTKARDRECVLAHERKHCAGWGHPHYKLNLAC